jgi:flagellar basal-body rod modification protein FlgD
MAVSDVAASGLLPDLDISNKRSATPRRNELGKDAFLELMITQLKNQNPLEPQGNAEFVAQLAQFSSLEGLQELNKSVSQMVGGFQSSQALQASALVGRLVKVETDYAYLPADGRIYGTVDLPASTSSVQLNVYDSSGALVYREDLGAQSAGELAFAWDGRLPDGTTLPAGGYSFAAIATIDGKPTKVITYLSANVNSVTLGANQSMTLNVAGIGPLPLSAVKEII